MEKKHGEIGKREFPSTDNLIPLINECPLKEHIEVLRKVEICVRNKAAHELIVINEKRIKDNTGKTPDEIMKIFWQLVDTLDIEKLFGKKYRGSYQTMNEALFMLL